MTRTTLDLREELANLASSLQENRGKPTFSVQTVRQKRKQLEDLLASVLDDPELLEGEYMPALRAANHLIAALEPYSIQHVAGCLPNSRETPQNREALREALTSFLLEVKLLK